MIAVETSPNALDECVLFAMAVAESSGAEEGVRRRDGVDPRCVEVLGGACPVRFRWSTETSRFESQRLPAVDLVVPFSVPDPHASGIRRILFEEISPRQVRMTARVVETVCDENVMFACAGDGAVSTGEVWPNLDVIELVRLVTASFAVLETVDEFEPHGRVARLARMLGVPVIDFAGEPIRRLDDPGISVERWDAGAFARAISALSVEGRRPVPRLTQGFRDDLVEAIRS